MKKRKSINLIKTLLLIFIEKLRGFLLGVFLSLILFIIFSRYVPDTFIDSRTIKYIVKNYQEKYDYRVLTLPIKPDQSPSIIIWGNDKAVTEYCANMRFDKKLYLFLNKNMLNIVKQTFPHSMVIYLQREL